MKDVFNKNEWELKGVIMYELYFYIYYSDCS